MAEQEVIKHTKKVYEIGNSKEHSFWHKVKELVIEIFIIVFAVSLSIWLHSWSEHRREQKEVKIFLLGLKSDISEDIRETKGLIKTYKNYGESYRYLSNLTAANSHAKNDTLTDVLKGLFSNAYLRPNISRYSGFSASGRLLNIENEKLSQDILNFYQELIPRIKSSENGYIDKNRQLQNYLIDNVSDYKSDLSKVKVLMTPKGKILCELLIPAEQLFERYNDFINAGNEIINLIDEEYGNDKQ